MVLRRVFNGRKGENKNEAEEKKTFEVQEVELQEEDLEANDPEEGKTEKEYIEEDQGDKKKSGPEDPRPLGAWNCFGRRSGPCRCGGLCGICDICDEDEDGGDGAAAGDGANVITAQPPPQNILQNPLAAVPAPVPVSQTTTPGPVRPGSAPTGSAPHPPTTAPAPPPTTPAPPTRAPPPPPTAPAPPPRAPPQPRTVPAPPTRAPPLPPTAPVPPTAVAQTTPGPASTSGRKRKSRAPSPDEPPAQRQRTPSPPEANVNVPTGGTEEPAEASTLTRAQQKTQERRRKGHHMGGRRAGRSAASNPFEGKPDSEEEELMGGQRKRRAGQGHAWDSSKTEVTPTSGSGRMSPSEIAAMSLEDPYRADLSQLGLQYRQRGAELQAWIADPTAPGCNVQQKIQSWETLLGDDIRRWDRNTTQTTNLELIDGQMPIQRGWVSPPLEVGNVHKIGLSHNNVYRQIIWQPMGTGPYGVQVMNIWRQDTGLGAIFARDILRQHGAHWGEVCQAQYTIDNPIETLKYVFVINCVNDQTWPYVMDLYYRKKLSYDDPLLPAVIWQWDSPEYQEILGTTIGRGVARLVLGSFPRGTRRIDRIQTWVHNGQLQLRFDIVEVNPTGEAV